MNPQSQKARPIVWLGASLSLMGEYDRGENLSWINRDKPGDKPGTDGTLPISDGNKLGNAPSVPSFPEAANPFHPRTS